MMISSRVNRQGRTVPSFQVDDCFAEEVKRWKWYEDSDGYIVRRIEGDRKVRLHRFIWELSGRESVKMLDHVNGDTLDNRLENLRSATDLLNQKNKRTRNFRDLPQGVYIGKRGRCYGRIHHRGKAHHLGTFDTIEEASAVYENAREMLIEFANLPGYEEVIRCQK